MLCQMPILQNLLNDHLAASAFGRKVEGCLFVLAKIVKYFEKNYGGHLMDVLGLLR